MNSSKVTKSSYELLKDSKQDDIDGVFTGKSFSICYLGCKNIGEDVECKFKPTATEALAQYSQKSLNNLLQFELAIDSMSVTIQYNDRKSGSGLLFSSPLCNIKDVLYSKRDKTYGNILIFVAWDIHQCSLTAHVLLCGSAAITVKICETFQTAFRIGGEGSKNNSIEDQVSVGKEKISLDTLDKNIRIKENDKSNNNIQDLNFDPPKYNPIRKNSDGFSSFAYSRAKINFKA